MTMIPTALATAIVVCCVSQLLLLLWRTFVRPPLRLPPGPRPLPIVGNLLMVKKYPTLADMANELKHIYGPIMLIWMGSKPTIIISAPEIIHEAMVTQGANFIGRQVNESTKILNENHRLITAGHGERHRFLRKLLVSEVLSQGRAASFKPIREQEIGTLIESLTKQLQRRSGDNANNTNNKRRGGLVTNFRELIRLTACNLVVGILFGRRVSPDEYDELDDAMTRRFEMVRGNWIDFIPLLALVPSRKATRVQLELRGTIASVVGPLIEERKQTLKSGTPDTRPMSFVDTLLALRSGELKQNSIEVTDADVEMLCMDVLNVGTDTTALNLEYCIGNLINHPDVQEKALREISTVVGMERLVDEDDLPRLPYLKAVIKEVLRRHSPTRLSPARRNLSATKLAGYDIPVNSTVISHIEGVSLSPDLREDPLEFRPERHLNKALDITGSTTLTMIPFGIGRRICPAINFAFLHAELILARLIQRFQWDPPTPGSVLDLTPAGSLTVPMKIPISTYLTTRAFDT